MHRGDAIEVTRSQWLSRSAWCHGGAVVLGEVLLPAKFELTGKTVVLTGAASGIGEALALRLCAMGTNLALVDRDSDGLARVQDICSQSAVKVSAHVLDVTDAVGIATLPAAVLDIHTRVDVLINNAGAAMAGDFLDVDQADFEWLINVNFLGTVRMTRAFLPLLMDRPQANITNISSIFGIVAAPGQAAYSASKFAVRGFSNALRYEMARGPGDVMVTTVHPGGIKTNIARNARPHPEMTQADSQRSATAMERAFITTPQVAADRIIHAISHQWARVIVGPDAQQMMWLERLRPVHAWDIIDGVIKRRMAGGGAKSTQAASNPTPNATPKGSS